jgi:hypothetical protein
MNDSPDESVANPDTQGGSSGTVQRRIVIPPAIPDLRIRFRHWQAVPVRKHHAVKIGRQHGGETPHILGLDV